MAQQQRNTVIVALTVYEREVLAHVGQEVAR
jgi:hypothetical protein